MAEPSEGVASPADRLPTELSAPRTAASLVVLDVLLGSLLATLAGARTRTDVSLLLARPSA